MSASPRATAWLTLRFGLWSLLAWLCLGLGLEAMHAFKVSAYLDYETRRLLWTLAHAHGVLLSVLCIGLGALLRGAAGAEARWPRLAAGSLMAAAVLLPGGFLLGGIFVYGGDPGLGVLLSPVGGALLVFAVLLTALHYRPDGS